MRSLRIVIADGGLVPRSALLSLCEAAGFEVVGESPAWDGVADLVTARAADVVIASGSPEYVRDGAIPDGAAVIAIAPDVPATKDYVDGRAFAILTPDSPPAVLAATATAAVARAADLVAARREADQLRDQLETRKLVERAKGVLMRRLGLSEDAAYRKMQKASQDENRKMRDIADSILSAERLYGETTPSEE